MGDTRILVKIAHNGTYNLGTWNVYPGMTHPYSIFIWQPPLSSTDEGHWYEPLQAYTQEYALYTANLIHLDTHAVIKVTRYGLNIACFPDAHTVELVERQIAKQKQWRKEKSPID